ncbi:MAG: MBL fold metallo-hydrolase [Salinivirgaceae bacterium]|jgi:7,8-dihydropterin-6-yl-methyl-4-(beta-D-ribofuranosyl)aminobenzene 5'-phosphate synthase|nr:MBL fold metallo-hydrolase [Salinivirgaceae bacterium]
MALKLKIYILVDNVASATCNAEHGLSYVIDFDKQILFDTGQSDLFVKNAKQMQIDIDEINTVVLSHGHYDHGNGLSMLKNKKLICHPDVFTHRFSGKQHKYVGINLSKTDAASRFDIIEAKEPYWISEKMFFLGEVPKNFGFEKHETSFHLENNEPDKLLDDSALVVKMSQGLFIVSGCAHSGICNIIEHAKAVSGEKIIFGVIGGFHLKLNNKQTKETVQYMKNNDIKVVMPSHCTDLPALSVFHSEFGSKQVKVGNSYTYSEE